MEPQKVTFANGLTLMLEDTGEESKFAYSNNGFIPVSLDQHQRAIFHQIRDGIHKATSHDALRPVDAFFQANKKQLPAVIAVALYSDLTTRFAEL